MATVAWSAADGAVAPPPPTVRKQATEQQRKTGFMACLPASWCDHTLMVVHAPLGTGFELLGPAVGITGLPASR